MLNQSLNIDVLLLSYNGEAYIEEQIKSIQTQLRPQDRIIISDDGSTDSTLDLIHNIGKKSNVPIQLVAGPGKGVIANFFSGIKYTSAEYVFLADQDDIWLPGKVDLFKEKMKLVNRPHLIFSDAYVWDSEKDQKISFWKKQRINPNLAKKLSSQAFRNSVQGASMSINKALIEKLKNHQFIMMHDWWCGLLACTFGDIDFINNPTLLYRQHANNQLGANNNRSLSQRIEASRRIFKQIIGFQECFEKELRPKDLSFFRVKSSNFLLIPLFVEKDFSYQQ